MIFHVINRVLKSKYCDEVLIATTNRKSDDKLEDFSKQLGLRIFRGSTNSVLSRFYEASKCFGIDIIIRITADDPFKDPYIIDQLIDSLISNNYDYVCNNMPPTYPEGLDTEVFTFKTLEKCFRAAKYHYEMEHVTPYIRENKNLFSIWNLCSNIDLSKIRLTVDTKDDLFLLKKYMKLYALIMKILP